MSPPVDNLAEERLDKVVLYTLKGMTIEQTRIALEQDFGSGFGDAANLNLIRSVRRVIKSLHRFKCQGMDLQDAL